jgi:uncharacterized caspase-like protein
VNKYKNELYNLNWARADAEAFAEALRQRGQSIFKEIINWQGDLYDEQATRENIAAAFREIQATDHDVFVFYYAGHGVMNEGVDANRSQDFYLALHDVTKLYGDDGLLAAKGISARELAHWAVDIKAKKKLIIFDACQSGQAVKAFAQMAEAFYRSGPTREKAILQLARSAGLTVIAAAGTEEYASEIGELGHGLFTYALLQGLAGAAATGEGTITVANLIAYLNAQVPQLTEKYRKKTQLPDFNMRGQDFPLALK